MSLTRKEARDEMIAMFTAAWEADTNSSAIPIFYQDLDAGNPPSDAAYVRLYVQHFDAGQTSLANDAGRKKFSRSGVVTIQIFTPRGDGLALSDTLSIIAVAAFEGKKTPGGVWFRSVKANEIGEEGPVYQVNVLAEFLYDEVR